MSKKLFLHLALVFSTSLCLANNTWFISDIKQDRNTYTIYMENGTVWKFKEDPGKTKYHTNYVPDGRGGLYPTQTPYHVPGRSSNNIKYFQKGDPITPCFFEGSILVFKNIDGENDIGCVLVGFDENALSSIYEIDQKGYNVIMSDGKHWTFSWWQAWASWYWKEGDTLLPVRLSNTREVLNLDRLLKNASSFRAAPNE